MSQSVTTNNNARDISVANEFSQFNLSEVITLQSGELSLTVSSVDRRSGYVNTIVSSIDRKSELGKQLCVGQRLRIGPLQEEGQWCVFDGQQGEKQLHLSIHAGKKTLHFGDATESATQIELPKNEVAFNEIHLPGCN